MCGAFITFNSSSSKKERVNLPTAHTLSSTWIFQLSVIFEIIARLWKRSRTTAHRQFTFRTPPSWCFVRCALSPLRPSFQFNFHQQMKNSWNFEFNPRDSTISSSLAFRQPFLIFHAGSTWILFPRVPSRNPIPYLTDSNLKSSLCSIYRSTKSFICLLPIVTVCVVVLIPKCLFCSVFPTSI